MVLVLLPTERHKLLPDVAVAVDDDPKTHGEHAQRAGALPRAVQERNGLGEGEVEWFVEAVVQSPVPPTR